MRVPRVPFPSGVSQAKDWTSTVICLAGLVYILRCTPWLLTPRLWVAFTVFLLGCALSALLFTAFLVWFLYKTTETYDPVKEKQARLAQLAQAVAAASRAAQKRSGRDAPAARGKRGQKDKRGQQVAEDQDGPHPWGVVDGRLKLTGDCELPPPLDVPVEVMRPQPEASDAALYTGVIWTVPASTWVPTQTLTRFPPACEGPDAISHRWYATLQDGVLSLRPGYGHAWPYRPEHPDAPLPALPPLVQLPLDGCEARVVTECFNGPRVWGKRGPVEVRVADGGAGVQGGVGETDRQLLYGETNFYFFAESNQAKEQWVLALQASCGPQERGAAIAAARATYAALCKVILEGPTGHAVPVAHILPGPELTDTTTPATTDAQKGARQGSAAANGKKEAANGQGKGGSAQGKPAQEKGGRGHGAFGWVGRMFGRRGQQNKPPAASQPAQPAGTPSQPNTKTDAQPSLTTTQVDAKASTNGDASATEAGTTTQPLSVQGDTLRAGGKDAASKGVEGNGRPPLPPTRTNGSLSSGKSGGFATDATPSSQGNGITDGDDAVPTSDDVSGAVQAEGVNGWTDGVTPSLPTHTRTLSPARVPELTGQAGTAGGTQHTDQTHGAHLSMHQRNSNSVPDLHSLGCTSAPGIAEHGGLHATHTEPGSLARSGTGDCGGGPAGMAATGPHRHSASATQATLAPQSQPTGLARAGSRVAGRLSLDDANLASRLKQRNALSSSTDCLVRTGKEQTTEGGDRQGGVAGGEPGSAGDGQAAPAVHPGHTQGVGPGKALLGAVVDGVHGMNMLLVRIGYELLRGTFLAGWLQEKVQLLLDKIKRPPYLQPLTVEEVDIGISVPLIKSVRAVAGPANASLGAGLWPQLAFDVVYTGRVSMTVSTKVELQRAKFMSNINSALTRLKGGTAMSTEGAVTGTASNGQTSPPVPATPAATPRGLSPTGSFHSLPGAPDTDTPPHHSASLPELTRQTNSVGPSTSTKPPLDTHNKPPLSARDSSASTGTLLAQATHHPHMHHSASASTVGSMGGQGGGGGGGFLGLGALRRRAAATAQQLTSQWVDSLARTPLQLIVDMTSFEGTVMVFLSPPPSDRLWISFLDPPRIGLTARPVLNGRALRLGGPLIGRVSALVTSAILRAITKELVFPACVDLRLGFCASADKVASQKPLDLPLSLITAMPAAMTPFPDAVLAALGATTGEDPAAAAAADAAYAARSAARDDAGGGSAAGPTPGDAAGRAPTTLPERMSTPAPLPMPRYSHSDSPHSIAPTPSGTGAPAHMSSGLSADLNKPGSPLPQRRGLVLGFRWRGWGGKGQQKDKTPSASRLSEASTHGPSTPGSVTPAGAAVTAEPATAAAAASTATATTHDGTLPTPAVSTENATAGTAPAADTAATGTIPASVGVSEGAGEGVASGVRLGSEQQQRALEPTPAQSEAGSADREGQAGGNRRQKVERVAVTVAGQSWRGLRWLGGNIARGVRNIRGREPTPAVPTDATPPATDTSTEPVPAVSDEAGAVATSASVPVHVPLSHPLAVSQSMRTTSFASSGGADTDSVAQAAARAVSRTLAPSPEQDETMPQPAAADTATVPPSAVTADAGTAAASAAVATTEQRTEGTGPFGDGGAVPRTGSVSVGQTVSELRSMPSISSPQLNDPLLADALTSPPRDTPPALLPPPHRFSISGPVSHTPSLGPIPASPALVPLPCGSIIRRHARLSQDFTPDQLSAALQARFGITDPAHGVDSAGAAAPGRADEYSAASVTERVQRRLMSSPLMPRITQGQSYNPPLEGWAAANRPSGVPRSATMQHTHTTGGVGAGEPQLSPWRSKSFRAPTVPQNARDRSQSAGGAGTRLQPVLSASLGPTDEHEHISLTGNEGLLGGSGHGDGKTVQRGEGVGVGVHHAHGDSDRLAAGVVADVLSGLVDDEDTPRVQ